MRIAVIDDSSAQREQLSGYIKEYYSGNPIYRQIDLFENGEQFMECWRPGAYDLLFIDIFFRWNQWTGDRGEGKKQRCGLPDGLYYQQQ